MEFIWTEKIYPDTKESKEFVVRDGLYRISCMSVCVSICVFSVFRIVNATSSEASLAQGIDQLYSRNIWQGVQYTGLLLNCSCLFSSNKQQVTNSVPSAFACPVLQGIRAVDNMQ